MCSHKYRNIRAHAYIPIWMCMFVCVCYICIASVRHVDALIPLAKIKELANIAKWGDQKTICAISKLSKKPLPYKY